MMNDLSENVYLKTRRVRLEDYTVDDYLYSETAIERAGTFDDVVLSVCCLLFMTGFNINLAGTGYLTSLIAAYIVDDSFDTDKALRNIAERNCTDMGYVCGCIDAALRYNRDLCVSVSELLHANVTKIASLDEVLDIFGAAYVIYYNYSIPSKSVIYVDAAALPSIWRIIENEQKRKNI